MLEGKVSHPMAFVAQLGLYEPQSSLELQPFPTLTTQLVKFQSTLPHRPAYQQYHISPLFLAIHSSRTRRYDLQQHHLKAIPPLTSVRVPAPLFSSARCSSCSFTQRVSHPHWLQSQLTVTTMPPMFFEISSSLASAPILSPPDNLTSEPRRTGPVPSSPPTIGSPSL